VHQRGGGYFSGLLQRSELLIEMFLRQQAKLAPRGRAGIDDRARILANIGDKLRLIKDEFQFNLLVRQAVDLVGFTEREEGVLRRAGRNSSTIGGARRNLTGRRDENAFGSRRTSTPDAVDQAQLGLVALASRHPELRPRLKSPPCEHLFVDRKLACLLEEICAVSEPSNPSDVAISSRLDEQQRGWFSEMMVRSLADDAVKARSLMEDYLRALRERQRRREVAELRQVALAAGGDEAVAAAQALIVARRTDAQR